MPATSLFQEWNISPARFFGLTGLLSLLWGLALCFAPTAGGMPGTGLSALAAAPGSLALPFGTDWPRLALFLGGSICIAAAVADWHSGLLPDIFTLYGGGLTVSACVFAAMSSYGFTTFPGESLPAGAAEPLLGAALGFAFLKIVQVLQRRKHKGEEQIGSGDAKLMLPLGAMVGPFGLLPLLLLACVASLVAFKLRRTGSLPFGPGLTAAGLIVAGLGLRFPPNF